MTASESVADDDTASARAGGEQERLGVSWAVIMSRLGSASESGSGSALIFPRKWSIRSRSPLLLWRVKSLLVYITGSFYVDHHVNDTVQVLPEVT